MTICLLINDYEFSSFLICSPYFWQLAGDRTGIWYAIFDGFNPANTMSYPRLIFSRNQFRGYELVKGKCSFQKRSP